MHIRLQACAEGVSSGLNLIEQTFVKYGMAHKDIVKKMLIAEEVMTILLEHQNSAQTMHLTIRRIFEDITVEISVAGEEFSFTDSLELQTDLKVDEVGLDAQQAIRSTILRSVVEDLRYSHRNGVNSVRITVARSKRAMLYKTLLAMALAVLLGLIFRAAAPQGFCDGLCSNLLIPGKTIFMNALKIIVAPVVFFSITSCVGQFSNFSEMGKIGSRLIGLYTATTVIASICGVGIFFLLGKFIPNGSVAAVIEENAPVQQLDISLVDTIVGIVPSNFLQPFLESNMLQLIFLAVLCGAAVSMIGKYSEMLSNFFSGCNELFLKITSILVQFMPFAAFCSILSMMLQTGAEALISVVSILAVLAAGFVAMMIIYGIILLVCGLNPITFFKKYAPTMIQVFSLASSNASLPLNIDACKKLGIPSRVYSLSIPLGATINMDGTCIYLSVVALGLAQVYNVDIPASALLSMVISIIVLSIGAPGIPGAGLVCLSVLLTQIGVPVEAIGLVMGIDPLIGMLRCMSNCLGDVSVSCAVAKKEGIIDADTYRNG